MFDVLGKYEIKAAKVYEADGNLYLSLKYHVETDNELREIIIPKISLDIQTVGCPSMSVALGSGEEYLLHCNGNKYKILPGVGHDGANHVYFTEKILRQKPKKMTVAEIEKKLGYKIEIVAED